MTKRQVWKLVAKVVLTVTSPIWLVPATMLKGPWELASVIVDGWFKESDEQAVDSR